MMDKIVRDIRAIIRLSKKVVADLKRKRLRKAKAHLEKIIAFDVDELKRLQQEKGDQVVIDECLVVLKQARTALAGIKDLKDLDGAEKLVKQIWAIEEKELSTIRLRAHHIGKIEQYHLSPGVLELSDKNYLAEMHKMMKRLEHYDDDFYSDEWFLGMRDIFKKLMQDPTIKIEYVTGPDSLCTLCHHGKECVDVNHEYHKVAMWHDANEAAKFPQLKKGRAYSVESIIRLFLKSSKK
jgi:hypothetical protein